MIPYYSEAYLGIGWSNLYQARELSSNEMTDDNFFKISELRSDANSKFILALDEITLNPTLGISDNVILDVNPLIFSILFIIILMPMWHASFDDTLNARP